MCLYLLLSSRNLISACVLFFSPQNVHHKNNNKKKYRSQRFYISIEILWFRSFVYINTICIFFKDFILSITNFIWFVCLTHIFQKNCKSFKLERQTSQTSCDVVSRKIAIPISHSIYMSFFKNANLFVGFFFVCFRI